MTDIDSRARIPVATARPEPLASGEHRWTLRLTGILAGLVAAGLAGTSTKTFQLGAVWAGVAVGAAILTMATYAATRFARASLPAETLRIVRRTAIRQSLSWSLGAYAVWFLAVEPLLGHAGVRVPMLPG